MTKDEAKQRCASLLGAMDNGLNPDHRATLLVDGFVLLGMLKIEEPKNISRRIDKAIWGHSQLKQTAPYHVKDALDRAGLKIVEK